MSSTKPRSTRPVNVSPGFYWRSKAVVNQRQGQPQVRVESAADGQQGRAATGREAQPRHATSKETSRSRLASTR
jgi:hypothetical protein